VLLYAACCMNSAFSVVVLWLLSLVQAARIAPMLAIPAPAALSFRKSRRLRSSNPFIPAPSLPPGGPPAGECERSPELS
jgi:hypothetical protein